jgi:TolA-binding protein
MVLYKELTAIEEEIIRFDTMRSLFTLMTNGLEASNIEDIRNSLYYVEGSLQDIHDSLRSKFDELWESFRELKMQEQTNTLKTNDYIQPESLMLDKIMREMK